MKRAKVITVAALFLALTFPAFCPGASWFRATEITDVTISTTRSDVANGWSFVIKQYGGSGYIHGSIMDNQNTWESSGLAADSALMMTINQQTASEVGIVAGDYLTVNFDSQTGYVFLPAIPWYQDTTTLYLSSDRNPRIGD